MKNIVITGVSTGIGYGAAKKFCNEDFRVYGSVRKQSDAERLKKELGEKFIPLIFDVTDRSALLDVAGRVSKMLNGRILDGLINNAGIAVSGPLMHVNMDDLRYQLEVNVIAVMAVTQAFLPMLGADKNNKALTGRIINMGSISGKLSFPFLGPYSASKYALEGITDALRRELQLYGIKVVLLEPGPVKTAIWGKVDTEAWERLKQTDFFDAASKFNEFFSGEGGKGIEPDDFSNRLFKIFMAPNPKTRYVITKNKWQMYSIPRLLPDKMIDKAVGKQFGLKK